VYGEIGVYINAAECATWEHFIALIARNSILRVPSKHFRLYHVSDGRRMYLEKMSHLEPNQKYNIELLE
jgi:hypothetical protein